MTDKVKLDPGDIYCTKCDGEGVIYGSYKAKNKPYDDIKFNTTCLNCYGKGKLDWIEQIVGVNPPEPTYIDGSRIVSASIDIGHITAGVIDFSNYEYKIGE